MIEILVVPPEEGRKETPEMSEGAVREMSPEYWMEVMQSVNVQRAIVRVGLFALKE